MAETIRTDRRWLLEEQYRTDEFLCARIELHQRFSTASEDWHRWVFDRLDIPAEARVLDVGGGRAQMWRDNADRIPTGWRLTITDLSPGMIDVARDSGVEATFAVVNVQDIPYADESFDAVLANHMLYHVPDRERALSELRRVLTPGGRMYATTIGDGHLPELRELAQRHAPGYEWSESHIRFGLETGGAQLEAVFTNVSLERFEDSLEVTDPDAVVLFIRSMAGRGGMGAHEDGIRADVAAAIARRGSFHVQKASGIFRCRKPA